MKLDEKVVASETVFRGRTVNLRVDRVELPNGRQTSREIVEHPGAVAIIALCGNGEMLLVSQYRAAIKQVTLEIPAGKLENGEDPRQCALRELEEETGYKAGKIEHLFSFYTTPGFSDEIMHVFVADDLRASASSPDADEFLDLLRVPVEEMLTRVENNEISDGKTVAGILGFACRRYWRGE